VYTQLKDTNDKLEDKNEEYRIINNELEEKNEELRITDETLKEKNDNLLAAEEELRSNLEDLHEKNEELRITDETLKERNDDLLAAEEELRSNLEELYAKNEELERSEDRFKFMSELISQGVLIHDKGIILDVNDSFCRLFKMDREDLINNSVFDLFGGGGNRAIFEEQLAKEGQTSFEVDVMDSTNTMISIHVQGKDVSYKNKTARVTVVMDISDRKNAERLLRESEERLRLAIKGTNDGLWDWNLTTNEVYFSDSWKEMLGYNDEDLCNEFVTWEKLMHPDDIERTNLKIDKLLKGDGDLYRTEFRLRHKSGRYLHILSRGYMIRDNKGTISRIIGTHQDLSHRYEAEERLRQQVDENLSLYEEYRTISEELHSKNDDLLAVEDELRANNKELHDKNLLLADSEERFKSLFEKSKSVMIILDSDSGKILEANNSACKFYGYTSEELLECYIHDINTLPDEEIERELKMAKEEERPYFTFQHKLKSGEIRDVDVFTSVINYSNKHYLYSIVIDRTETVKANNEIAKVNRRLYGLESIVHYEAKSINDLLDFTLQEIKEYTNSEIGLFYHYDKTKGLFLLNNWSESAMLSYEINSISQSDKLDCLTKAVSEKKTIIINDNRSEYPFIVNDHDKKAIHKSVTIPIIINNEVEAVVWIGSNTTEYTLFEMQQVSFLLETTWILVEKQKMQDLLKSKLHIS